MREEGPRGTERGWDPRRARGKDVAEAQLFTPGSREAMKAYVAISQQGPVASLALGDSPAFYYKFSCLFPPWS